MFSKKKKKKKKANFSSAKVIPRWVKEVNADGHGSPCLSSLNVCFVQQDFVCPNI